MDYEEELEEDDDGSVISKKDSTHTDIYYLQHNTLSQVRSFIDFYSNQEYNASKPLN